MTAEYQGYSESGAMALGNTVWNHTLSAQSDRILLIGHSRMHQDTANEITACTVGGENATKRIAQNTGGDEPEQDISLWSFEVPADWNGAKQIICSGGNTRGHGWAVEAKGASGKIGTKASAINIAVTVPSTLSTSLIVDRFGRDAVVAPVSNQNLIDTYVYNPGNVHDCAHAISWAAGGGNIVMSYTAGDVPHAICAVEVLSAPPPYRMRPVEYTLDVWDPEQRVLDSLGHVVPKYKIKPNNWIRVTGLEFPTAEVYANFYDDPTLAYIESVKYNGETDQVQIVTNRGELPEVIMARLASGSTG